MKVEQEKGFQPITITLETQEEIDVFIAISNFPPIKDKIGVMKELFDLLYQIQVYFPSYKKTHEILEKLFQ